ncbi:uncharacterized protein LOC127250488 [Andrographis paniculata]|uniref:uncharacterized protein LOC127250488 n=1 Tax=Andrographis paniculata TaxID=175694 RepID=UPI0021E731AA|nr:uncharacterized protein LOC127250488 [Andrographis paniculata]
MKTNQPKLKTPPRSHLFSCGFFRHCTQTVLSPTTSAPPPLPAATPPPQPPPPSSSSSSSSNTSQSFTQWRFPLSNSPFSHNDTNTESPAPGPDSVFKSDPGPAAAAEKGGGFEEMFHVAELQFGSGSDAGRASAVQVLERSLVPNPRTAAGDGDDGGGAGVCICPVGVVGGVVACLREGVARKAASKVLLALCLVEANRRVAVEAGAVMAVVEALADAESAVAERSLAALELLCTTAEGAAEVRGHALAVPMMVQVMGRMEGRGKEHAISVLAVIYGGVVDGAAVAPAEEVARAVMLALQGECSARGRRKGAQLLKILQENGRLNVTEEGR